MDVCVCMYIFFFFSSFVVYTCTTTILGFFVLYLSKVWCAHGRRRKNVTSLSFFRLLLLLPLLFRQKERVIELCEHTSLIQSRVRNQQTTFSLSRSLSLFSSLNNNINHKEDGVAERAMSFDNNKKRKKKVPHFF
jgi:hypothetical protein